MQAHRIKPPDHSVDARLSPREHECLSWVVRGKSSTDISSILNISPRTVDSYMEKVCAKLHVRTRIEAVALAVAEGLLSSGWKGEGAGQELL